MAYGVWRMSWFKALAANLGHRLGMARTAFSEAKECNTTSKQVVQVTQFALLLLGIIPIIATEAFSRDYIDSLRNTMTASFSKHCLFP